MKKNLKYLVWLFIILAVFAGIIIVSNIITNKNKSEVKIAISENKASSYTAERTPVLEEGDLIIGDKKNDLLVFVYEDYANIYSANLAETLSRLLKEYPDLTIISRPYFSDSETISRQAALAVSCASEDGKGQEMRNLLFDKTKKEELFYSDFNSYAEELTLETDDFSVCLTNKEKSEKLDEELKKTGTYSVIGAPTIFIDGEIIIGARPYEDYIDSNNDSIEGLKNIIERKLGK